MHKESRMARAMPSVWQLRGLQLRLSVTTDIVLEPPKGCRVLVNPANEALFDAVRPHFQRNFIILSRYLIILSVFLLNLGLIRF